jgi:hypothetical protein
MATKGDRFPSKYLSADDLVVNGTPRVVRVRIAGVRTEEIQQENGGKVEKCILSFEGKDKGLVCNATNWDSIAQISAMPDDADWKGVEVELYRTMVEFKGKNVPALRVRPVGGWDRFVPPSARAASPDEVTPELADDSEIPF